MSSTREPDEASSSKSKGKAVDPTEHPNGGGNVDEANQDEDKEDAEPIDEENAFKLPNPATSSKAKKTFGMHKAQPTARKGIVSSLHSQLISDGIYEATTHPTTKTDSPKILSTQRRRQAPEYG